MIHKNSIRDQDLLELVSFGPSRVVFSRTRPLTLRDHRVTTRHNLSTQSTRYRMIVGVAKGGIVNSVDVEYIAGQLQVRIGRVHSV